MLRLPMTTLHPRMAYLKANSLPMPAEAPVITITEPAIERFKKKDGNTLELVSSKFHSDGVVSHDACFYTSKLITNC